MRVPGNSLSFEALGLFAGAVSLALLANFLVYIMVGEVNRKLPDDKQIRYLFWYPGKLDEVKGLYRQFYPGSRLVLAFHVCGVLSLLLLLAFAWKFGFFR